MGTNKMLFYVIEILVWLETNLLLNSTMSIFEEFQPISHTVFGFVQLLVAKSTTIRVDFALFLFSSAGEDQNMG